MTTTGLSFSGRLVRPFANVLALYPGFEHTRDRLHEVHPEDRIDIIDAYGTVERWVEKSGDADLGLKAALQMELGNAGLLDYAIRSATCLRDEFALVKDYSWYFSDSLQIDLTIGARHTVVRLDNDPSPPRAVTDFTLGAWFRNHLRSQLEGVSSVDCYFSYPAPTSTALHQRVFTDAKLQFDAGFDGFGFDSRGLDCALPAASPTLHALHCELLEGGTRALRGAMPTSARVRRLVARELRYGRPVASHIARQLHMSRRTLIRRLSLEDTSFSQLVSEVRRALALRLARANELSISEISRLVGFSHTQAFHRQFKDWTGTTPGQYRKLARASRTLM